jgi:hypothetical protein
MPLRSFLLIFRFSILGIALGDWVFQEMIRYKGVNYL